MTARKRQLNRETGTNQPATPKAPASTNSSGRLSGQVAVVTGANGGISWPSLGPWVGEGCDVVITGRDLSALAKAKEELDFIAASVDPRPKVLAEPCEVQKPDSVTALFAKVKKRWGRLDILVNNAGISQSMVLAENTSVELWRSVLDTNLTGLFLCSRAAVPLNAAWLDHREQPIDGRQAEPS